LSGVLNFTALILQHMLSASVQLQLCAAAAAAQHASHVQQEAQGCLLWLVDHVVGLEPVGVLSSHGVNLVLWGSAGAAAGHSRC